jgi:hypothetical protein
VPFPNPDTQFKPGQSGNPDGHSKKRRLTSALIKAIETKGLDDPFVMVGLKEALKGNFRFWAYIFDRVDGKVTDKLDVTSGDEPLQPVFEIVDNNRNPAKADVPPAAEAERVPE